MEKEKNTRNPGQTSLPPAGVPDKFWDEEKGEVRTNDVLKSYLELEKKLGNRASDAPENKLDEQAEASDEEAPSLEAEETLLLSEEEEAKLAALSLSEEQANAVKEIIAAKFNELEKNYEVDFETEVEKIETYFGSLENFEAIRPQLRNWAEKNIAPEILEDLSRSSSGVIMLYRLMRTSEPQVIKSSSTHKGALSEENLRNLMASPKYWRDHDASYVKKVEEGFALLYPEE